MHTRMRLWIRRATWLGIALVVALALLAGIALGPVDRRDARELVVHAEGLASARAAVRGVVAAGNDFRAGAGRAVFTPTVGAGSDAPDRGEFMALPLAGYGQRQGKPAQGVADPLWAKAVAFVSGGRTGVVVSADSLIIPREVAAAAADQIRAQYGVPREALYFGATHTHSGPGGWGQGWVAEAFAGGYHPGARPWMAQQLATAVGAALADLQTAALATASITATQWVRNRLVGERGRIDPRFNLISIVRPGAAPILIGAYAAHATVLSSSEMHFSGDYPGAWQLRVERQRGGTAVFLAGAVGSHAPRPPESGRAGAAAMGEKLADLCLATVSNLSHTPRPVVALASAEIPLPALQPRVAQDWKIRAWLAGRLLPVGATAWVQALRLGDAVWLATPCDFSGELALDLAERHRASGVEAVVTSFNGDYLGYVVPADYYSLNTYETRTMAFFGPQLPPYLMDVLGTLVDGVVAGSQSSGTLPAASAAVARP